MTFLTNFNTADSHHGRRNGIKASAGKRRLGVRVAPGGFTPPGGRGEALSRSKWVGAGGAA